VSSNHSRVARVDTDVYFELEPGMTTKVYRFCRPASSELTTYVHCGSSESTKVLH
jgi:hypothetical protein